MYVLYRRRSDHVMYERRSIHALYCAHLLLVDGTRERHASRDTTRGMHRETPQ